jgi:uncharacterized protein
MRCPVCLDTELVPHIRDGIEVDHCPRCRGVWLDRGELHKLLDLAEVRSPESRISSPEPPRVPAPLPVDRRSHDDWDDRRPSRKRKRKGSFAEFLEEVFDAFD